jgi:hypothetical protein
MAILGRINQETKRQKIDQNPDVGCTNETAAALCAVSAKAVKWNHQPRNMESIPNKDLLTIE